jgi:hypothetical protein
VAFNNKRGLWAKAVEAPDTVDVRADALDACLLEVRFDGVVEPWSAWSVARADAAPPTSLFALIFIAASFLACLSHYATWKNGDTRLSSR